MPILTNLVQEFPSDLSQLSLKLREVLPKTHVCLGCLVASPVIAL